MFTEKNYETICLACGKVHIVRSAFLGSSLSVQKKAGGLAYPAHSCGDCPGEKVREAWALMQAGFPFPWQTKAILRQISDMNKKIWDRTNWGSASQRVLSERARTRRDRLVGILASQGHRPRRLDWALNFELES